MDVYVTHGMISLSTVKTAIFTTLETNCCFGTTFEKCICISLNNMDDNILREIFLLF